MTAVPATAANLAGNLSQVFGLGTDNPQKPAKSVFPSQRVKPKLERFRRRKV